MDKIYSRRRFIIKPFKIRNNKIIRKFSRIVSILLISIYGFKIGIEYLEPIYKSLCIEKVKSVATIITNQQSTIVMNEYQYDELYTIEKDTEGKIIGISSNVVPINNMISDLTEKIQAEFNNISKEKIYISLGSLTGIYLLSGFGPKITIPVDMTGTVETDIKSEFISQGINQTLHRVYVIFECDMSVVTSAKSYSEKIENQFIIAEHIIVGDIPNSYYDIDGTDDPVGTVNITK